MSTPSDDRRASGLVEPDELEPASPLLQEQEAERGEDYHPGEPRPDLSGAAAEADVVEQAFQVSSPDEREPDVES